MPRAAHFPQIPAEVAGLLRAQGLELFGIAAAAGPDDDIERERARAAYRAWIEGGFHGGMTWLERHEPAKYDPSRVLPGCRSVIVAGMNYYQRSGTRPSAAGEAIGRVARYAWGRDYHNALGKRLRRAVGVLRASHPGESFRPLVDASPLSERFLAGAAGIGFTGRNTLSISSAYGSWFFLGEILTTLELPSSSLAKPLHGGCPAGCFRCGAACPTGALYAHGRVDARRCISYLTIEHGGSIPEELRPLMGDWVFGCDLCQETCPHNVRARETTLADFTAHRAGERLRLDELLALDDDAYRSRFAGTPLLRPGRDAMVRNACIAAANTGRADLVPVLAGLAGDRSPIVREHARWAVGRLTASSGR